MSYLGIKEEFRNKEKFEEIKKKSYEKAEQIIENASNSESGIEDTIASEPSKTNDRRKFFYTLVWILGCMGGILFVLGICTFANLLFGGVLWIGILLIVLGALMVIGIYPLILKSKSIPRQASNQFKSNLKERLV